MWLYHWQKQVSFEEMARGNLTSHIYSESNDEFGILVQDFNNFAKDLPTAPKPIKAILNISPPYKFTQL